MGAAKGSGRLASELQDDDDAALILRKAVREVILRLRETVSEADPAPWYDVPTYEGETWAEGDAAGFVHRKKLEQLAKAKLKIALLSGDLVAQFSDGAENCDVPGWAWREIRLHDSYWFDSCIPIDPFLPDDWYRWSGHEISLDRRALNDWLAQADLASVGKPPVFPEPHDVAKKPLQITARLPRDSAFVTISEAVSWVAFGISMDQGRLSLALEGKGIDPTESRRNVSLAMAKLADRGTGGSIAMRGKYVATYLTDDRPLQTEPIDPVRLADFARFDVLHDGLAFGDGLAWIDDQASLDSVFDGRDDAYRNVTVNRAELLNAFPARFDDTKALLSPLPAALPGVGPVLGMEEALSWLAHGKPSDDVQLWQNALGWMQFRFSTGETFNVGEDSELPEHHLRYREANRVLWSPLQDGNLTAYVEQSPSRVLAVPRHYWNQVDPAHLDHVYRGMSDTDDGRGCPILLYRLAFDEWRNGSQSASVAWSDKKGRAPAVKAGRPPSDEEILAKADEMKARGLDGRTIAGQMRHEPGFENVATTEVRELIKGRWRPSGRPKQRGA
jgi:hypothetical protein